MVPTCWPFLWTTGVIDRFMRVKACASFWSTFDPWPSPCWPSTFCREPLILCPLLYYLAVVIAPLVNILVPWPIRVSISSGSTTLSGLSFLLLPKISSRAWGEFLPSPTYFPRAIPRQFLLIDRSLALLTRGDGDMDIPLSLIIEYPVMLVFSALSASFLLLILKLLPVFPVFRSEFWLQPKILHCLQIV